MSKRWSYNTVEVKPGWSGTVKQEDIQSELTRHGTMGWELVTVVVPGPMYAVLLIFKKEV